MEKDCDRYVWKENECSYKEEAMNIRDATHVKNGDMLVQKHIYASEYRNSYSPSREPFEVAGIEFCGDDIIFVSKSGYKWKHKDVERYNPV